MNEKKQCEIQFQPLGKRVPVPVGVTVFEAARQAGIEITSACGGTMAGLEVQKSLINKPVKGVLRLVPEFSPGHIQTLILG